MLSTFKTMAIGILVLLSSSAFANSSQIEVPRDVVGEIQKMCKQYDKPPQMQVYCTDAQIYGYKDFGYLWAMHSESNEKAKAIMLACLDSTSDKGKKFPDYAMTLRCTIYYFEEEGVRLDDPMKSIPDVPSSSREVIKLR